jgi:hypothetical protein
VIGSNAGFDTSSVAWELRELCRQGVDDRFYLYSPPGIQASWISERDLETQRRSLPPEVYQRLWENRWIEGSGSLITREQLDVCVDPDWGPQVAGRLFTNYSVGLDLGLTRDRTARCVVHREPDGVVVVDSMKVWQGSRKTPVRIEEIEHDLLGVDEAFRHPRFSVDPWQLAGTAQRLESKLAISEFRFTSESVRRLSENLVRLITNGLLKLYPDPDLEHELLSLQMIQTSFGFRMDHRSGGFSDRAMALAMAALQVVESPITSSADVGRLDTLLEETRPRGSERSRFADVVKIPGVPDYGLDRFG